MTSTYQLKATRRRRMTIVVAGLLLLALIGGVSYAAATAGGHKATVKTAHGVVTVVSKSNFAVDGTTGCHGVGAYDDLVGGGMVVIETNVTETLATTQLQPGEIDKNGYCAFTFSAQVPSGHTLYDIAITRRQPVQVSEGTLFSQVNLTLGV